MERKEESDSKPTQAITKSFFTFTLSFLLIPLSTLASTPGPTVVCETYPNSASCTQARIECVFCHTTTPQLNAFGLSLQSAFGDLDPPYSPDDFANRLPEALQAIEGLDSDNDGENNLLEINNGTLPGDADSNQGGEDDAPALTWNADVALQRVSALFCGQSPSYQEKQQLNQAQDKRAAVHAQLSTCLNSDYWANEALHRLADNRIRPLEVVGIDGSIVLADYAWDYRLFSYVLRGDRDARDLLLADYHVEENDVVRTGTIGRQRGLSIGDPIVIGTGQPLPTNRRAGMITTQWFLTMNTMFAELPRNTAAQAYRAYLGLDIAKGEGLQPIAGEPRDVDNKNIDQPACAVCHSTLDPLAYAFSTYNGIEIDVFSLIFGNPLGNYNADRAPWEAEGFLFGEPVANVTDWANKAAQSKEFKQNLTKMLLEYALQRELESAEQGLVLTLADTLESDGHSANKLLHRIIDTDAFGGQ